MKEYKYTQIDFEKPSKMFVFEDVLKNYLGGLLLYNKYYRTFGLTGNEKVLDFGCGGGTGSRCLLKLLGKNGQITCIDLSRYWIKIAAERLRNYPNAVVRQGDIREMNIKASSFDVITIYHVMHDIVPEIRQETVNKLATLLKSEGRLFIVEPIKLSHGMPVEEIRSLFKNAGLVESGFREDKSYYSGEYVKL